MTMTATETISVTSAASRDVGGAPSDLDTLRGFFDGRLSVYGADDPHALAWGSRESQEARFAVLAAVGAFGGASILDVGCGVGDLYGYLVRCRFQPAEYLGIDISDSMIEAARQKYPDAGFRTCDLLAEPLAEGAYDYVVESGIFNIEIPNWQDVTYGVLAAMYRTCRCGVAANFLSSLSGHSNHESHYVHPADLLRHVTAALTTRVTLRHDYRTNDFTVYLYK